jgi:F-type H+-transporting ATPase subunit delta
VTTRAEILGRAYGREIQVQVLVDPHVLGGLRVQVGPEVIDATVLARLADARRRLAS